MRAHIIELVSQALGYLKRDGELDIDPGMDVQVEQTRDPSHGDYACNIALILAKPLGRKPREIAEADRRPGCPSQSESRRSRSPGPGF
jgi:arginyl-tRNA synthetase